MMMNIYKLEKIHLMLKNNLELVLKAKNEKEEDSGLILLIVLYELRNKTADIINEMQIADG
jgi:hypothetical protein